MPTRIVVAVVAAALMLPAGCTATDASEPTRAAGPNGYVIGGQQSLTRVPPAARKLAPNASGSVLGSSRALSIKDFGGKVVVLNVWGSWCAPCRQEAADLQQASLETAKSAQFIGINSRDSDPAPAEAFVRAFKVTYPSLYDPDGKVLVKFAGDLPLSSFPSTLIIDKQGRIAARVTGPITKTTLVDLIGDVADGK